jgi:hypothetical protein
MAKQSPWARFALFVLALIIVNVVLAIVGSGLRISIIGSIVLTVVLGGLTALSSR